VTTHDDFYLDVRWCAGCGAYVPYLRSPGNAWCVWCGDEVRLFSTVDMAAFRAEVKSARRAEGPLDRDAVA
jgi:hypothetical protein